MLEVYLGSEPTINESIGMAGGPGVTQTGLRVQVKKSREAGRAKATEAIDRFDTAWSQNRPSQ